MTAPQLSVDTVGESTQYNDVINSNTERVKISPKESDISEEERKESLYG